MRCTGHIKCYVSNQDKHAQLKTYTVTGYDLLARRSLWCNQFVTSLSCGPLYARFGQDKARETMAWRCYCAAALHPSKYAYYRGGLYSTNNSDLLAIN